MKIMDVINPKELEGVTKIKCTVLLKSSWYHSEFVGVVVSGTHLEDGSAKIMTVNQMKVFCEGHTTIEFVNAKNPDDSIFKYMNNRVGFAINMNSNTNSEIVSSESMEIHPISLSPTLKIAEEYSKAFRISEDNKVISLNSYSDYELFRGLNEIIQSLNPSEYLRNISGTRERAIETIATYKYNASVTESMEVFGK